jgi:tRNA threonylcarbamoyladenosine biosynthesis protein TsaE
LIDDYLTADAVAFLEWPEAAKPRLESPTFRIAIRHAGGDDRSIEIDG